MDINHNTNDSPIRAKLIFNPTSGAQGESPAQLIDILTEMQAWNILPEVHLLEQGCDLAPVVVSAIQNGCQLIVVSGGDGTIDTVASAMAGQNATLGIIPTGTQNNVALSLGIPGDIPAAVALLRTGRLIKVDLGRVTNAESERWFLEVASVGLLSALFDSADDIQHGKITRLGDFLATLASFPEAELHLVLDENRKVDTRGHVVVASNMPYLGAHFQVAENISYQDGLLDVLVFANLNKLDLIGYAVQMVGGTPEDPRIQHYKVQSLRVETDPHMPLLVDGFPFGESPVTINVERRALAVMAGGLEPTQPAPGPNILFEQQPDAE